MPKVAGGLPIGHGASSNIHQATHGGSGTILIVDDDPANLGALGGMLRRNYQVLAAPSGARALEIAAGAPKPDLILLDVMMPDMDGHAVIKHLRENPATRDIPVIFVTGMEANELVETHGPLLSAVFGALGDELAQRIGHCLYPEALESLLQVRKEAVPL